MISIGHQKQLFIDRRFIEAQEGIRLRVNPPRKAGIVLKPEKPWEEHGVGVTSVLEDEGICRMWYSASPCPDRDLPSTITCEQCGAQNPLEKLYARVYACVRCGTLLTRNSSDSVGTRIRARWRTCCAVSRDGVHWERPRVDLVEFRGSKGNNIVRAAAVMLDPKAPPGSRYRTVVVEDNAIRAMTSPDGLRWRRGEGVALPFTADAQNQLFWDSRLGKYVAYLRGYPGRRTVVRCEMDDPLRTPWPHAPTAERKQPDAYGATYITDELPTVMDTDAEDPPNTDIYNPCVLQYPFAQDVYLAFPGIFRHYPGPAAAPPGMESHRYYRFGNDGPWEVQLFVSRDGIRWERPERRPYLSLGIQGEPDAGLVGVGLGMVRRGDKLYQYYSLRPSTHGAAEFRDPRVRTAMMVGRLEQDLDRFVAAEASAEGWLLTPPLVFSGTQLHLNIDCGALGEAWVELRDEGKRPIQGCGIEDCDPVDLNSIRHVVTWHGTSDLGPLAGQPIRIYIRMRRAKLFAFQFASES